MNKKRLLSLFLLSAVLASVSCGEAEPSGETTAGSDGTNTTQPAETKNPLDDDLGEYDFNGETFTVNTRPMNASSFITSTIDVTTENGETINDAIYRRNRTLEDRFNFIIKETNTETDRGTAARTAIMAGDPDFDVFLLTDRTALTLAQEGMLIAYDSIPEIDLSKPYWAPKLSDSFSIADKHYFAYGDFNLMAYDYTHILLFNKKMTADLKLDSPYSLVSDGKWTIDRMAEMMKNATRDLNGDTVMDDKDCYGYTVQSKQVLPGFWIGAGVESIQKDGNDIPTCKIDSDSHFSDVIDKIFAITQEAGTWYADLSTNNADATSRTLFINNQSLFHDSTFYFITQLRDMDTDFGMLPYPKWDEAQDSYYSRVEGGDFAMIPVTNNRLTMTGVILEALSSVSAKEVIPAYYEKVLKGKITRDDESAEMLDIIYQNRTYDLGDTLWNPQLRDGIFKTMFDTGNNDLASQYAGIQQTLKNEIQKTVDAYAKLK